ncbi:hypothetical protein J6590_045172 [Homalodisca vitripennis]|nr:hypothetical protein J6590_045172 [Homalodisca vitripennis]
MIVQFRNNSEEQGIPNGASLVITVGTIKDVQILRAATKVIVSSPASATSALSRFVGVDLDLVNYGVEQIQLTLHIQVVLLKMRILRCERKSPGREHLVRQWTGRGHFDVWEISQFSSYQGVLVRDSAFFWLAMDFNFPLLQRLGSDAVSELTPGIWSHVHLKRFKESRRGRISKRHIYIVSHHRYL